jgi:hypothetical protein
MSKMTPEQFLYWLSGALEDVNPVTLKGDAAIIKLRMIKDHLELVMTKVTPEVVPTSTKKTKLIDEMDLGKILEDARKKAAAEEREKFPWGRSRDYYVFPYNGDYILKSQYSADPNYKSGTSYC